MAFLFGRRKTPQEMLRQNQRALNKAMRDLDRERQHMEQQEKKIINDIKKMAKQGQMDAVKIMVKDLVRTRRYVKKFILMRANIQAVALKIQTLKSNDAMAQAMKGVTKAMMTMNKQLKLPQIQKIMMEFEKQSEIMDMKEEMMNDAIDDAMGDEDDEDERSYMRGAKCPSVARVDGKIAIVTGANSGIGLETAKGLAYRGARVILACRDELKAQKAIDNIKKTIGQTADVTFMKLDLASLQSVRDFAAAFKEPHVNILVNNAGVMCHPQAKTVDGLELHFQTNYLGHFLLTHLLLEKLAAAPGGGRVINVTANAYKLAELVVDDLQFEQREYKAGDAYLQSKLAILLFSNKLAHYIQGKQVTVNSVNPGVVRTNIHRYMPFRQNFIVSLTFAPFVWFLMKSSVDGSQCSVYCAVAGPEETPSGKYFSECKMTDLDAIATDAAVADKLWIESFKLCGLPVPA